MERGRCSAFARNFERKKIVFRQINYIVKPSDRFGLYGADASVRPCRSINYKQPKSLANVKKIIKMTKKFKVYRSSAGSGKTFTLTKEYLKLLFLCPANEQFSADYYKNILAVTFTNEAANEMKHRIVKALSAISNLKDEDKYELLNIILKEIAEEYPEKTLTRRDLILRSQKIYERLLHFYSDFAVSTIDSFNNRLVRSFTKDLDLPYNYEIEMDSVAVLENATLALLNKAGDRGDAYLTKTLLDFAKRNAENSKDWNIEKALQDFGLHLFKEDSKKLIAELEFLSKADFTNIRNTLFGFRNNILSKLKKNAEKAMQLIENEKLSEKHFYYGIKGIYGYFQRSCSLDKIEISQNTNSFIAKTMNDDKWYASKIGISNENAIDKIKGELAEIFEEMETTKAENRNNFIIVDLLLPNIYLLSTISEMDKEVKKQMTEENKVHISEFNEKINKIIEKEPVPYIYERLGEKFKHILIDEFQDTSQMQWHNLIPLISNSLDFNLQNLIVGDAKQAIYRWRGGNSELIVRLPDVPTASEESPILDHIPTFERHYQAENLQTNWRSRENIISFNNLFFKSITDQFGKEFPDLRAYYAEIEQEKNKKKGGQVDMIFFENQKTAEHSNHSEESEEQNVKDEDQAEGDYSQQTFNKIYEIVQDLVQNKGFMYKDMAILTRLNSNASFLAEQFLQKQIQVISSESLLLSSSPKVNFIVNFLRIMAQPLNPMVKAELIYFVYKHFNEELEKKDLVINAILHEEVSQIANEPFFSKFLMFLKQKTAVRLNFRALQYLSMYEIAEELIRLFRLNENNSQQIYLQKLLDVLLDFGLKQSNNLLDFIEYWDKKSKSISVSSPKTGNAIQIMTLHKSKGLQFPVVFVPFADWGLKPRPNSKLWLSWENDLVPNLKTILLPVNEKLTETIFAEDFVKEQEKTFIDSINMLYVALTRPEDRLYILGKWNDKLKDNSKRVSELLQRYADNFVNPKDRLEIGNCKHFKIYDDPDFVKKSVEQNEIGMILPVFLSTESRDKIRMRRNDLKNTDKRLTVEDLHRSKQQGLLMHYAFEKIRYQSDLPKALRRLLNEGWILEKDVENIKANMIKIMDLPEIKPYFLPKNNRKVRNEMEVLVKIGEKMLAQRPDRVVIDQKEVTIIDYKTGTKLETHEKQINRYGQYFESMGFEKINKFLVYTEKIEVLEIKN
ncbi:MAG: hypothetical protein EAZ97_03855 [Bacteroidetes bacterium]|nr:MAG: hypothetical protein EAZ97_03855 [Bacteroidota bacterium]